MLLARRFFVMMRHALATYRLQIALMLAPFLIGLGVLVFVPMVVTVVLSFTDFDIFSPPRWLGLDNYAHMFDDTRFQIALFNSLWFVAASAGLRTAGALLLALALNRSGRALELARAAIYLPTLMPEVAYALIWLLILNPGYGPLNLALGMAGIPPFPWLQTELTARISIVAMSVFELGEGFVVMLAALQIIPADLLEAAALDGAGRVQRFRRVMLPLLAPALLLLIFRDTALSFQDSFVPGLITTETGPYYATYFLPHHILNQTFGQFRYGYGSAMTVVMYAIGLLLIGMQYGVFRRGLRDDVL
jgi:multiple sugar transport system permease protein